MLTMCRLSTDSFSASGIAIGDVQPQSSVWAKHSPYFSKYGSQLLYILFWRIFDSNLTSIAVIPQAIIRWACDTHGNAVIWKCSQSFQGICTENFNHRKVPLPLPVQSMQSASHPAQHIHHRHFPYLPHTGEESPRHIFHPIPWCNRCDSSVRKPSK